MATERKNGGERRQQSVGGGVDKKHPVTHPSRYKNLFRFVGETILHYWFPAPNLNAPEQQRDGRVGVPLEHSGGCGVQSDQTEFSFHNHKSYGRGVVCFLLLVFLVVKLIGCKASLLAALQNKSVLGAACDALQCRLSLQQCVAAMHRYILCDERAASHAAVVKDHRIRPRS